VNGRYPKLPILVISFTVDIPTRYWHEAGASGIVSKANLGTELIKAVGVISEGVNYFPNEDPEERLM
jgi:hypothetical protein